MKPTFIFFLFMLACGCGQAGHGQKPAVAYGDASVAVQTYAQVKDSIAQQRLMLAAKYPTPDMLARNDNAAEVTDVWVGAICGPMFEQWQGTPWDFNGTTLQPQEGSIACGYFVTTVLRDMGVKIDRVKLAICASSVMMKTLVPEDKLKNLSSLSYDAFNDKLTDLGKGVYVIGLDFHTGFIVNDGVENWFIHSNYIDRRGVMKERVLASAALKVSKTRWLVSLTGSSAFLHNWLHGKKIS